VLALGLWMASGAFSSNSEESDAATDTKHAASSAPVMAAPVMKVEYIDVSLAAKSRDIILQGQLEPKRHLRMRAETSSVVDVISISKGQRVASVLTRVTPS